MKRYMCFNILIFTFLTIKCGSSEISPDKPNGGDDESIIFHDELITVNRKWDEVSNTYYFLSRIKHKDGKGNLLELKLDTSTYDMGESVHDFSIRKGKPIIAINASTGQLIDNYRKSPGILIMKRKIIRDKSPTNYTFAIKDNNELIAYPKGVSPQEMINDGTIAGFSVFTPIILDYKAVSSHIISLVPNQLEINPRQVIAQYENNDILIFSCGGRGYDGAGMKITDVIRILQELDERVRFAHNLDGGGSVTTVIYGNQITKKIDGNGTVDRLRPTFLYIESN